VIVWRSGVTERVVCEVAIIGGGVIGLSCARDLKRKGIDRVVVLEKEGAVGMGSSSRANGGVRAQFTTAINIDFSLYSIAEFERLQKDSGGLLSFHQKGYLLMTGTEEGERGLQAACQLQLERGVATQWLSQEDVARRVPFVRVEGLRAGTFHERDGFLDPHEVVQTMRQSAITGGAQVYTNSMVDAIDYRGHRFAVHTSAVDFEADWVVDAAGSHAHKIGELVGIEVPVEPVRRNLVYMRERDGSEELIPMCVDLDTGVLVRREVGGGYVVAYSDPDDPPGWDVSVDPKFFDDLADRVGNRFPFLEDVPLDPARAWAGLYPETADHHAIVGPSAENERFVICAGFGGHGIMHSPAAGRAVSEIIADGRCSTFDLRSLRPSRFAEDDLVIETAVL
jgi:sarcosine oxidase subunit beta